jgi:hypothetical protein
MRKHDVLKGYFIAITGDFGKARSTENMKRWIESNGGRYSAKVEEGVTHLISTKDHWTKGVPASKRRLVNVEDITEMLTEKKSGKPTKSKASRSSHMTGSKIVFKRSHASARRRISSLT